MSVMASTSQPDEVPAEHPTSLSEDARRNRSIVVIVVGVGIALFGWTGIKSLSGEEHDYHRAGIFTREALNLHPPSIGDYSREFNSVFVGIALFLIGLYMRRARFPGQHTANRELRATS